MSSKPNPLSCLGTLLFLCSLVVYSLGVSKTLQEPITSEEAWYLYAGEALNTRGTYDSLLDCTQASAHSKTPHTLMKAYHHPPAQIFLIAKMGKIFGDYILGARLLGLLCVLSTSVLLLLLAFLLFAGNPYRWFWAWLVGSLFLADPVTIKSSISIFMDQSTFLLSLTLFQLVVLFFMKSRSPLLLVLTAGAWTLCLFSKLTSSLLLLLSLVSFLLLHRKSFGWRPIISLMAMFVVALGILWFLMQCLAFPSERLFSWAFDAGSTRFAAGANILPYLLALTRTLKNIFLTSLWMGPFLILLFLAALVLKLKDYRKNNSDLFTDFVSIVSVAFVFGHAFVGGTYNQFPRYMTPGLPGLCLLAVWILARFCTGSLHNLSTQMRPWLGILFAGTLWYWLGVGDFLYSVTFRPRAIALGQLDWTMLHLAMVCAAQCVCYTLPFLLVGYIALSKKNAAVALFSVPILLASFFGMDIAQIRAKYGTYYCYGESGSWQAIELAKSLPPDRAVMAPYPIVYYKSDDISIYRWERDWYYKDKFLEAAQNPKIQAIVYGMMDFPVRIIRQLEEPEITTGLIKQGYQKMRIGSYTVWMRK